MKNIPMPPRHSMADKVVRAASKSLFLAASKSFGKAKISEVGEIVSGSTPSTTKSELWDGDIVWITPKDLGRPRNIEIDDSERKISPKGTNRLLPKGTVLFSSRAPIGHAGIAAIELCTNQGFKNIICSPKLYNRYLFHILRANIEELDSLGHGNTFKEIPAKVLAEFEIPVPPISLQKEIGDLLDVLYLRQAGEKIDLPELSSPLTEQCRIVTYIESLAARVNEVQRLREEAEIELSALIDSTLGHLLVENNPNWSYGRIPEFAEVNPSRKGQITLKSEDLVSFVPMKAVDDITGTITRPEPRPFHEVGKGYTWFQDGDVIFARITPCMENGKSAIANNLVNGTGFGSTEFHVLRPGNKVLAEWLHILARSKQFKNDAAEHFKGTAGQQRVPQSFLDNKVIPVPPLGEQRRIVAYLDSLQAKVSTLRELQSASGEELSALMPSVLDRAFKGEL
jgi:type I restriction enzyme, S subunit